SREPPTTPRRCGHDSTGASRAPSGCAPASACVVGRAWKLAPQVACARPPSRQPPGHSEVPSGASAPALSPREVPDDLFENLHAPADAVQARAARLDRLAVAD